MPRRKTPQLQSELLQARVTPDFMRDVARAAVGRSLTVADYVRGVLAEAMYGPALPRSRARPKKGGRG